ncbi:helix-turn-helix domain-containing protein [Streptomyces sp. H27-D2]|uniref:helix-turn-helix domain-containing protein n=1 Tax=Streptomyces sp. H27-D2 TaxID=3046304 RepID=UPI002DB97EA0|nr:helix-turn-helix domain-containing protein [Streptomyces sp. H27-D2]MEC4018260.1 helix-turn-helix domain-containing protein [Streptomyces sp. H27-D2]
MDHQNQPRVEPACLNVESAATYLAISANTLYVWRNRRQGPPSLRMGSGGRGRYRGDPLEAWLTEQQEADSHSNPAPSGDTPKEKRRSRNLQGSSCELDVITYLIRRTHDESTAFVSKAQREAEMCAEKAEAVFTEIIPATSAACAANARVALWG